MGKKKREEQRGARQDERTERREDKVPGMETGPRECGRKERWGRRVSRGRVGGLEVRAILRLGHFLDNREPLMVFQEGM